MTKPKPLDLNMIQEEVLKDYRIQKLYCSSKEAEQGINAAIFLTNEVIEKRIKSASEFWLRYCQAPDLLQKEYPNYYEKWLNYFVRRVKLPKEERKSYMEWLFKTAFKDVLKVKP